MPEDSAQTLEKILAMRKAAGAIQLLFKEYKHVADRAGEVLIVVDVVMGQHIAAQPKAKGAAERNRMMRAHCRL